MRSPNGLLSKAFLLLLVLLPGAGLSAQNFIFSSDIPVVLGGVTYLPNQIVLYSGGIYSLYAGTPAGLPAGAHIDAVAVHSDGSLIFSADAPFTVGSTTYLPADVIRCSGGVLSIYLAGSMFSAGANVDAIAFASNGDLLLSLDAPEQVGATLFQPEDVVRVTASVALFFDGSSSGVPPGANVSGFNLAGSDVCLNFDAPVNLGGTVFKPWEIVKYSGGNYSLLFQDPAFPSSGAMTDFHVICSAPGEVGGGSGSGNILEWTSNTDIRWPSSGAANYRLYRGAKADLPNLLNSNADSCYRYYGAALSLSGITETNSTAGDFYWYLVTGIDGWGCEGSAGSASAGPRQVNYSNSCP